MQQSTALPENKLAGYIDHTFLRSYCTPLDIKVLCSEAVENGFFGVCVPPYYVFSAKKYLAGSATKICTVIGFPMGYSATSAKVEEIKRACNDGVDELDVVVNVAAVKSKDWNTVANDIESTTVISHMHGKKVKLIIEQPLLSNEEIIKVCQLARKSGVDFIKTSTGFTAEKTAIEHVAFLKNILPASVKIKASGGIRTQSEALGMIKAGASRLGTSSGVRIITDY